MTRPNLWVKVFAPGIGDLVVILPILKNLKLNYMNNIKLLVFNQAQADLIKRFNYVDEAVIFNFEEDNPRLYIPDGEFYIDIAETPMESKYWWGSEEFIKDLGHMHIYDVMRECMQIDGDFDNMEPLNHANLKSYGNTILLGIGGRRGNKLWFNDYWWELYKNLKSAGFDVGMVGDKSHNGSGQIEELEETGIPYIKTNSLDECIDVISSAKGMITIDSGLMHISAMQCTPTVSLFGPMPSWLWGPKGKHVVNLDGGCGINCSKMPLDWECIGRPCMRSIEPLTVQDELESLLHKLGRS